MYFKIVKRIFLCALFVLSVLFEIFSGQAWAATHSSWDHGLGKQFRSMVEELFPDLAAELRAGYGLHRFKGTEKVRPSLNRDVILVHGLDDPGLVWQDLAPILAQQGYRVWVMNYPNDQPLVESSLFFLAQLRQFAEERGVGSVALVCHSMGGLVAREILTNPDIDYPRFVAEGMVPPISHLIMVGTPNHGSVFAQLRIVTEVRDLLVNAETGKYHWLMPFFDGAGEAGDDLQPHSEFLNSINSRPLPHGLRMLVIAGRLSPLDKKQIRTIFNALAENSPHSFEPYYAKMAPFIEAAVGQVGDGVVAVESAKLAGVELKEVEGTHLTIVRNFNPDDRRMPPAIPLVLDELAAEN
jgi:pimeloyl-ACP methyl ester carboxylesterase